MYGPDLHGDKKIRGRAVKDRNLYELGDDEKISRKERRSVGKYRGLRWFP